MYVNIKRDDVDDIVVLFWRKHAISVCYTTRVRDELYKRTYCDDVHDHSQSMINPLVFNIALHIAFVTKNNNNTILNSKSDFLNFLY